MSQKTNVDEKTVNKDVTIIAVETDVKIIAKSSTKNFRSNDNLLCQMCGKNSSTYMCRNWKRHCSGSHKDFIAYRVQLVSINLVVINLYYQYFSLTV